MTAKFSKEVQEAISATLFARSERELRDALGQHEVVLLTKEAQEALEFAVTSASEAKHQEEAARVMGLLQLVQHASRVGIEEALESMRVADPASAAVTELFNARGHEELSSLLTQKAQVLLTDQVLNRLRLLADNQESHTQRVLARHRLKMLERAQRHGLTAAIAWEKSTELLLRVMNSDTPEEAERIISGQLGSFTTAEMGEVAQELLAEDQAESGGLKQLHRIRGLIIQASRSRSSEVGFLLPRWLDTSEETRHLSELLSGTSSLDELRSVLENAVEADPRLFAAFAEMEAVLQEEEPERKPSSSQPSRPSHETFLGNIMDGLDTSTEEGLEGLIDEITKTFGPPVKEKLSDYEMWLVTPEPWLRDLDLPHTYFELARSLSAGLLPISMEMHRLEVLLADTDRKAEPLKWSALHRQLAFLNLVMPDENLRARLTAAFHHCKASASVLNKRTTPVAWANTHALYGEVFLAFHAQSSYGAVERKLRSIEPTAVGRIGDTMWSFRANRDSADQAAGRFELALQVYRQSENLEEWATALLGLATALALRWRGDKERNEQESLKHFQNAIAAIENQGSDMAPFFRARFGYCAQYLSAVPLSSSLESFSQALKHWNSPTFEPRRRGLIEHLALRTFRAGEWEASFQAIQATLETPRQENLLYHAEQPSQLSRASYLCELAAYSLVQRGLLDEALVYFERSSSLLESSNIRHSADDLLQSIPSGVTVVAPLITEHGSAVLVLPHGLSRLSTANIVMSDQLNDEVLSSLLVSQKSETGETLRGWLHSLAWWRERPTDLARLEEMSKTWGEILDKIGQCLINPILDGIPETTETIVFVPHRGLSVLPLHAAPVSAKPSEKKTRHSRRLSLIHRLWRLGRDRAQTCLIDHFPVAYSATIHGIKSAAPLENPTKLLTVRPEVGIELDFAEKECATVAGFFPDHLELSEGDATIKNVLAHLHKCSYLHFACHGRADWDDALNSSLLMTDGHLTVRSLAERSRLAGRRLVTLSACETGLNDFRQLPSANLGMVAALREAGVACVLSSRWPVSDAATFLVMRKFYEFHIDEDVAPSIALALAQRWLRALTKTEAKAELGTLPDTVGSDRGRPFSSPFYWAAFAVNGL